MRGLRRAGASVLATVLMSPSALAALEITSARATTTDDTGAEKSYT